MTNLKFRVWLKKHKQMYDVDAISFSKEMIQIVNEEFKELVFDFNEVKILQSTGLFDKNGKEIFEGDIVKFQKDIFEIKMNNYGRFSGFCLNNTRYNNIHGVYMFDFIGVNNTNLEIIGSIYENSELLNF